MAVISRIVQQKRRPGRCSVYLDSEFALGCSMSVVVKLKLRAGMELTAEQVEEIRRNELRQACLDRAMRFLARRMHSRAELRRKLKRQDYGEQMIESVVDELMRLGYVDDERFAMTKALSAAQHKHHGRRRALLELRKCGISGEIAERAVESAYEGSDGTAVARQLAQKQAARLRRLDPVVARRRLAGMLERRGFTYEQIKPVIDEVVGENC